MKLYVEHLNLYKMALSRIKGKLIWSMFVSIKFRNLFFPKTVAVEWKR